MFPFQEEGVFMSRNLSLDLCRAAAVFAAVALAGSAQAAVAKKHLVNGDPPRAARVADGTAATQPAAARSRSPQAPLDAPVNDDCTGAIVIPDGRFPVVTAPVDVTEATPQGSDDPDACPANGMDATVWFSFTPSASGEYIFSTCLAGGATGSDVYDTVIGIYDNCPGNSPNELGCNDSGNCESGVAGAPYTDQGVQAVVLTAGTTYYIVAGHWSGDTGGISPGYNQIAVQVDLSPAPTNDTCDSPDTLALDRITFGTTASATNDYRSPAACFTGQGQIPSSSNGLDVVYSFVPPSDGLYSFRYVQDDSAAALRSQSPVLYLTDNCPAPDPSNAVTGCIAAANRMNDQTTGNGNRSEEINCVALTGGSTYYLFFDDRFTANPGGPFALEVTSCHPETEPNDTPATATAFNPNSGCFMEGSATPSGAGGDVDFFDLGAPPAGSKIFVGVDAAAANQSDFEMRITNTTDTLGYDDNDGTSWVGSNAPIIGGVIADGNEIFARVDSVPAVAGNEPYLLFARIETGPAQNEDLPDPPADPNQPSNGTFYGATHVTGGGFVKGVANSGDAVNGTQDSDCFRFVAHEGDNIVAFSDNNPGRAGGTITNVWPILHTIDGDPPPAAFIFQGQVVRNLVTPSPGTLTGTTPSVTSEFMHFRARYTGAYALCFAPTEDVNQSNNPSLGSYPLPYQGSISINCGPVPAPETADVSVTKVGPGATAKTGDIINYTITLTNNDPTAVAQDVRLVDNLPAEETFIGLTVNDGFGGNDTGCISLPSPGANDAPLDCTNYSLAPGGSITYTLTVQINNCAGSGLTVSNTASITTFTTDPNPANDSATDTLTTTEDGSCQDLLCDATGCISNACTVNDHCDATGGCVSDPLDCDDHNLCTADSCDPTNPAHPCINDSTQLGDLCNDGNVCTLDGCDPVLFCVFPPAPAGGACDDFLNCTLNDQCDGLGNCIGHSVCDDGLPCTDDFADEANNCACDNPISFPGTMCDDGNVCTTGTTCDGVGGTVASCTGGTPLDCDDHNPCTDDSCDPVAGCVHTNNAAPCDDGNACTSGDTCGGGVCNAGGPATCDDANPCTDDSCDPATGCVHTANDTHTCDDGSACTTGDACVNGACQGTPVVCSDGNACNGVETCNPATGCVAGTPLNCNDNNPCTDDSCNPASGCVHANNTAACDDGSACTTGDVCSGGACVGTPVVCNDGNACNGVETCNPATGCVAGTPLNCNDNNPCTDDSCAPATGCVHVNNTAACNDGNACTSGDVCSGGTCAGTAISCNDNNPCTDDSCAPATGCVHTNNTASCNDGNACTTADTCANGVCVGGNPVVCTASDSCHTVGTCDTVTGACSNPQKPNGATCDDGNACTTADTCNAAGQCIGGPAPNCDDGDPCTGDSCNSATGCVHGLANFDAAGFSATRVDGRDLVVLANAWSACPGDSNYSAAANLDATGCVDLQDFHLFMTTFGQSCP
jgi:uncharacterized repeat protein (TIGR01451 family)